MQRRHVLTALAASAALPSSAFAQVTDLNDAINKAGRQRMLSQRMGKAWLALVHEVEPNTARPVLDRSMALFDRQLVELKAFAPTPEIRDTYSKLESAWSDYKTTLVGSAPGKGGAAAVLAADARARHQRQAAVGRVCGQRKPAGRDGPRDRAVFGHQKLNIEQKVPLPSVKWSLFAINLKVFHV
jgi:hypothetical protein